MSNRKILSVEFPESLYNEVVTTAEALAISKSDLVRIAVNAYICDIDSVVALNDDGSVSIRPARSKAPLDTLVRSLKLQRGDTK